MSNVVIAAVTLAALAAGSGSAAAASEDPLAPHRWRDRILLALAPAAGDPGLARQRRIFQAMAPDARERDLILIEAVGGTAEGDALRRRFGGGAFQAVLIGKDGGAKLASDHPLGPTDLFPLIDAMPMRRDEMRRRYRVSATA